MLVAYSSSSSSSSDDEPECKKSKLGIKTVIPSAITMLGSKQVKATDECNESKDNHGRIRSFPHERGNWATFVYIAVHNAEVVNTIEDIIEQCQHAVEHEVELHCCNEIHLSMSKTFVLQYHLIEPFVKSLTNAFDGNECFGITLGDLKIYTNEERTRTFIAFAVNDVYCEKLKALLSKVDAVLKDYKLPLFYKPPSFHVSFLWCLGDKIDLLNNHIVKLTQAIDSVTDSVITVKVDDIRCKSGNKEFIFTLT